MLPPDVIELVVAARIVAHEDQGPEALRRLDAAAEAFAARVPWDDEPDANTSRPIGWLARVVEEAKADIAALPKWIRDTARVSGGSTKP